MLPDRIYWLLTAYVDGELNTRQRKLVQHLVRQSAEARTFLRRLQQDAEALRGLPRRQLGALFTRQVLQALAAQPAQPVRSAAVPVRALLPTWIGWAVAAAVLFLVSTGSYLYFADAPAEELVDTLVVRSADLSPRPDQNEEPDPERLAVLPAEQKPAPTPGSSPAPEEAPRSASVAMTPGTANESAAEPPRLTERSQSASSTGGILTAPNRKPEQFVAVPDPGLPVAFRFRELDQEKSRRSLREELQRDRAARLELACAETFKAFPRLQTAFEAEGVQLLIDQDAQVHLALPLKTNYVLYSEQVTTEELVRILHQVGREDQKAEAKRRGDGQFDRFAVSRLTAATQKELRLLLGLDPIQVPAPQAATPLGMDPRQPLPAATLDQVVPILKGQGPSRSDAGPMAGKVSDRWALVLTYDPARLRAAKSWEIKRLLDQRREPRAGAIQVFLVLRGG
ncbi:MAG: hypothetical protein L0Z62_31540 [Gemmataceae bacterium]|nr:hypothetical protein [Gemmataceae bacterium]